jgi:hypothetical protein
MKRSSKVLLTIFIVLAAGLYIYLFIVPKIVGISEKTAVLEYGDLPVKDESELLIIRDETLFSTEKSGTADYDEPEGMKVRKGVRLMSVEEGAGGATGGAIEKIKERAGGAMKATASFKANKTAVVSYYGDGYERSLSAGAIASITKNDMTAYPDAAEPLKSERVSAGDPVYKLTNNNEWYMVYWVKPSGDVARYETGSAVTVSMGGASVDAEVSGLFKEGNLNKVILKSDYYYEGLPIIRKAEAEIVFAEYSGLIAEKSCIIERGGVTGVYVRQRGGSNKWVPVNVLREADGRCTLAVDVFYDDDGKPVNTVSYYDEVLLDPKNAGY